MRAPRHPVIVAMVIAALLVTSCRRREPAPRVAERDLIPRVVSPIVIDGEWHEPDWTSRATRGQFVGDDGKLARPSSEIRLLHDPTDLLVALYAGDENIETGDAFELSVGRVTLRIDSTGTVTPPIAGVRARVDLDEGTRDNPIDDDEEWVVELAVPLALVDLKPRLHQPVRARRCDTPKDHLQRCGSWSGILTIE